MSGLSLGTGLFFGGCVERPVSSGFSSSTRPVFRTAAEPLIYDADLKAQVAPPSGWHLDPPKASANHTHKTWISPTGDTAYGVIRFDLPFAMADEFALWGFMRQMRATEGEATLLEKKPDPALGGIRFVAEGGLYKVRVNLSTRGAMGWAFYAGSLRARGENASELDQAIAAREASRIGEK